MPMKKYWGLALLYLMFHTPSAWPDVRQNPDSIRQTVERFAREQTRVLPGTVTIKAGEIDPRLRLPACQGMETFIPAGGKLFGNSTVGVRCSNPQWTVFVPVQIRVSATMLVASKPLHIGQTLREEDLAPQQGELASATMLTDPEQAIGKVLKFSVAAGQPLRQDMLRAPYAISQGQTVKIQVEGDGFTVQAEGQALGNAAQDQNVRVRTQSGLVISGFARADGSVTLTP